MDGAEPSPALTLRFGPSRRVTALAAVFAAVALALAATTADAAGRVLFLTAAAVLAGYAAGDVLFWPRLQADARGLRIRTPAARLDLSWAEVEAVHADVRLRYGLRSSSLEIDAGTTLIVFSRRALGEDPAAVAALLHAVQRLT